jgi:predicted nucleic acid-binding protein
MSVVFTDAFYFVARLNRRDQHHQRALQFSRDLRARLLTSDWVLMEVADALAESECRGRVRDFILHLRASAPCEIVPASRELLDRALDFYHQRADKKWTLTDCVSFVIMRERAVTDALTGDKHFEQAGFVALLK